MIGEKEWGGGEVREDAADEEEEWEESALRSVHLQVKPIRWNALKYTEVFRTETPSTALAPTVLRPLSSENPQNDSGTHTACVI